MCIMSGLFCTIDVLLLQCEYMQLNLMEGYVEFCVFFCTVHFDTIM